jgi:hypothetical protein
LEVPEIFPIDYCYLRPDHVKQVNELLVETFWPGIDSMLDYCTFSDEFLRTLQFPFLVSENLTCPDHTVVVLYKRLVIGCGLMTPQGEYFFKR